MSKTSIKGIRIKNNEIQIVVDDDCKKWQSMSDIDYISVNEYVSALGNDVDSIIEKMNKHIPKNTGILTTEKQSIENDGDIDIQIQTENPFDMSNYVDDEDIGFETEKTEDEDAIIGADAGYKMRKADKRKKLTGERESEMERNGILGQLKNDRNRLSKVMEMKHVEKRRLRRKAEIQSKLGPNYKQNISRKQKNHEYIEEPYREAIFFNRKTLRVLSGNVFIEVERPIIKNKISINLKTNKRINVQKTGETAVNRKSRSRNNKNDPKNGENESLLTHKVENLTNSKNKLRIQEREITEAPIDFFKLVHDEDDDSSVN